MGLLHLKGQKYLEKALTSVEIIQQIGKTQSQKDNTEAIPSNFFNYDHEKGICGRWTIQKIALSLSQHQART